MAWKGERGKLEGESLYPQITQIAQTKGSRGSYSFVPHMAAANRSQIFPYP